MTNVHIVNHTHWDREWYFTSMDALVLSDQLFSDVIQELQINPQASFVLDGQISILDDYLELYPEQMPAIKKLVANKQLFIGPWFTQTDAFFTSGESVLRNAMIGIFESKKYGDYMPIAYLPDTFGFNAQMPTILKEAGFESIIMWRGLNLNKHVNSPYFKWQGLGGEDALYTVNLPQGYSTGMLLEPTKEYVQGRLDKGVDFIKQFVQDDILIPSGNDQLGIITDFEEKVKLINDIGKYTYKTSSYVDFIDIIKKQSLPTYKGELREPVLARVHKTIGSVRMDLKKSIFHLEDKLTYKIEPMMVIASQLGIHLSNRLLIKAWKNLLECQAHDSLAGCVSDPVAVDIEQRLKQANEICDSIENIILKRIAESLSLGEQDVLVLNPSLKEFSGEKTVCVLSKSPNISFKDNTCTILKREYVKSRENILEETPAGNQYIQEPGYYKLTISLQCTLKGLGYKVFTFSERNTVNEFIETKEQAICVQDTAVFFEDNTLVLKYEGTTIPNFISLVDEGNAGDTYDFSPLQGDTPLLLCFETCTCYKSANKQKMELIGSAKLPYNLQDRETKQNNTSFKYKLIIILEKNGELSCHIQFKNTVLNHRLRLQVQTDAPIKNALAGLPYGFIERTNQDISDWEANYLEKPVPVEPFEKIVSASTKNQSMSLFSADSREYEYAQNNLWVTILATTDTLGKPDLLYRPGRASGDTTKKGHIMMDTPLAQLKNETITFDFCLKIKNSQISLSDLSKFKEDNITPSIFYQKQSLNYFIYRIDNKIQDRRQALVLNNTAYSLINLKPTSDIFIASVHNAYYTPNAFIVRLENPTEQEQVLNMQKMFENFDVQIVNAVEELKKESSQSSTIEPFGIKTLLLKLKTL